MDYILFTYPNCAKCEDLKRFLAAEKLSAQVYKVEEKEGRLKIREFLASVKRDDKGAIILPTLILREDGAVSAVLNSRQEFEEWLRSRG
jgi:glutaredoxin